MRTRTIKAQNLRLGDWIVQDHQTPSGEVVSMSQLTSLPSGRLWDIGLARKDWAGVVSLWDDDLVTVERK